MCAVVRLQTLICKRGQMRMDQYERRSQKQKKQSSMNVLRARNIDQLQV